MADDEMLNEEIAKESNPEYFEAQKETPPPPRPKPVHPSHEKPMEEVKPEERKVKLADPKHAFPQE